MKSDSFNKATVLFLAILFTILFILMIKGFFKAIFLAAVFAGLLRPFYLKILRRFKQRTTIAGLTTMLLFLFVVLIPFSGIVVLIGDQALNASKTAGPYLQRITNNPDDVIDRLNDMPIIHLIFPDEKALTEMVDNVVKQISNIVLEGFSNFSTGTADFVFKLFIFLFSLYYFLVYGIRYLDKFLYYLPLKNEDEEMLLGRFVKVTTATIKGTFVLGIIQGGLGALTMFILGIPNTLFWGMVMVVLSIIPALGTALVWIPAAIYLFVQGSIVKAMIMFAVGIVVIGNIDNLLRPRLVGKGAQMPDLMILFSTLGGIAVFGIFGIIIGPIIAALFMTIWEIYGKTFKEYLHPTILDLDRINDELEEGSG